MRRRGGEGAEFFCFLFYGAWSINRALFFFVSTVWCCTWELGRAGFTQDGLLSKGFCFGCVHIHIEAKEGIDWHGIDVYLACIHE
jgi:hypothetical protein